MLLLSDYFRLILKDTFALGLISLLLFSLDPEVSLLLTAEVSCQCINARQRSGRT